MLNLFNIMRVVVATASSWQLQCRAEQSRAGPCNATQEHLCIRIYVHSIWCKFLHRGPVTWVDGARKAEVARCCRCCALLPMTAPTGFASSASIVIVVGKGLQDDPVGCRQAPTLPFVVVCVPTVA